MCCLLSSPLDELIDKLGGAECVAEMTGRRWRVVRQSASDLPTLQSRDAALQETSNSSSSGLDTLNVCEVSQCWRFLCPVFWCLVLVLWQSTLGTCPYLTLPVGRLPALGRHPALRPQHGPSAHGPLFMLFRSQHRKQHQSVCHFLSSLSWRQKWHVSWFNDFIGRFSQETKPRPQKLGQHYRSSDSCFSFILDSSSINIW